MIIDGHTHMIHQAGVEAYMAIGGAAVKKQIEMFRTLIRNKPHATDVKLRVAQMDRFGISYQVATPVPTMDPGKLSVPPDIGVKMSKAINDSMARITEESQGRVLCAGCVAMKALGKGGLDEMQRAVKGLGLKAISIMTNIGGKPLDAPEFRAFWAKAAELETVVFIHPADPGSTIGREYEAQYYLMHVFGWPFETTLALSRLVFSGIMDEFPGLNIVNHHLGGMIPFYWGRMIEDYLPEDAKIHGISLKRPLKDYYGRFYYDTAVGDNPGAVKLAYDIFGPDHLVFATDAPFGPGTGEERLESYPRVVKELGLPKKDTEKILAGNAKRIFRIK